MKTNYSELRKQKKLHGTIKNAKRLAMAREANKNFIDPLTCQLSIRKQKYIAIIPLGNESENDINHAVRTDYPRRRNWDAPEAEKSNHAPYCRDINHGYYSSKCTYTHWTYRPTVGSWAMIASNGAALRYYYKGKLSILPAPAGYHWVKDSNGIKIVSVSTPDRDYHPDSDDLRHYRKSAVRQRAIDNYNTRRAAAKQQREDTAEIKQAEREGLFVSLADSIKAGNCRTGTINFAHRHKLDATKHYRPTKLLAIANGEAHRVRLAVTTGLRRHRQEMRRGFCEIAEHRA